MIVCEHFVPSERLSGAVSTRLPPRAAECAQRGSMQRTGAAIRSRRWLQGLCWTTGPTESSGGVRRWAAVLALLTLISGAPAWAAEMMDPVFVDGFDRAAADFTFVVGPAQQTGPQGKRLVMHVEPDPLLAITSSAQLALTGAIVGTGSHNIHGSFEGDPDGGFSLTLTIGGAVAVGSYNLTVDITAGGQTHQQTVQVAVVAPAPLPGRGIVYVRVPRAYQTVHLRATDPYYGQYVGQPFDPSMRGALPEVSHILSQFSAPGQLVWRHPDGTQTIIFDCVNGMPALGIVPPQGDGDDACVPLDPMLSFGADGQHLKVAFAVYHGEYHKGRFATHALGDVSLSFQPNPGDQVGLLAKPTWAGIYIYDFDSRTLSAWPHQAGQWDTAPVWLPNGQMMFTTTRANVYNRVSDLGSGQYPILQLWLANQDGSNAHNIGTQDQDDVLHPYVHSSGRVFYSSHEIPFARYWDRYGTVGGQVAATPGNVWWVDSVDLRGGDLNSHLGTHDFFAKRLTLPNGQTFPVTGVADHFLGELSNGDVCADVYYRRNNFGAGRIMCWPTTDTQRSPLGHEGEYALGVPQGAYIAVAGDSGDTAGIKVRDPAGLPDGKILFAGSIGEHSDCHWADSKQDAIDETRDYLLGLATGKTCDFGIYSMSPLVGYDPWELPRATADAGAAELVNDPHWQEFMPKAVMAYAAIYGQAKPQQPPLSDTADCSDHGNCTYGILAAVDAFKGNLRAEHGWNGPKDGRWCHFQGCALQAPAFLSADQGDGSPVDDFDLLNSTPSDPAHLAYVRFWQVIPNDAYMADWHGKPIANLWGQRVVLMGDVPVEPDGSFQAKLPADVPFLMAGVDSQGRALARHQHIMAMRPGEQQVCAGCHLHATSDAVNAGQYVSVLQRFLQTQAGQAAAVAPSLRWPDQNPQPEWNADIQPMLKNRCGACHDGAVGSPAPDFTEVSGALYHELTNYRKDHLAYPVRHDLTASGEPAATPWLTRDINGLFARESLLYWKAAGQRMDGRTDATRADDFDFGAAHPSHLTESELRELSDWIEGGVYCQRTGFNDKLCND